MHDFRNIVHTLLRTRTESSQRSWFSSHIDYVTADFTFAGNSNMVEMVLLGVSDCMDCIWSRDITVR